MPNTHILQRGADKRENMRNGHTRALYLGVVLEAVLHDVHGLLVDVGEAVGQRLHSVSHRQLDPEVERVLGEDLLVARDEAAKAFHDVVQLRGC